MQNEYGMIKMHHNLALVLNCSKHKKAGIKVPAFFNSKVMKSFSILFIILCILLSGTDIHAQKRRIFLFNEFIKGTVLMKNKSSISVSLNYDASNHNMMYLDKDETMIMTGIEMIDTIFVHSRKFIATKQNIFLEVVSVTKGYVYINWKIKEQILGKKGAYGQITQGSVSTMDANFIKQQAGTEKQISADVTATSYENEYWLFRNEKSAVKFKDKKSLLKLFPDKRDTIEIYIKENSINMKSPVDVIKLADYCLGL